jgi:hypothetical protein
MVFTFLLSFQAENQDAKLPIGAGKARRQTDSTTLFSLAIFEKRRA